MNVMTVVVVLIASSQVSEYSKHCPKAVQRDDDEQRAEERPG